MAGNIKSIAASVHQRLLGKARESARPFNEFLQHFAIERFIYRLSRSPQADRFILKGALLFSAWSGPGSRPTMDIDLLGRIDNSLEVIVAAMKDACERDPPLLQACPRKNFLIEAEVAGTREIKYWVLGWGAQAEVLEPAILQEEVLEEARSMADYEFGRSAPRQPKTGS